MIMEYGIIATGDLSSVNPITLKDFIIIGLAILGAAGMIKNLFGKNTTTVGPDPLRIEKLDKFATRDFCEQRHSEVSRRLDGHDKDVRALYDEIKKDRDANEIHASERSASIYEKIDEVRSEMNCGFKDMERAIGRIEGKVSGDRDDG
jgi:hypothetical protein